MSTRNCIAGLLLLSPLLTITVSSLAADCPRLERDVALHLESSRVAAEQEGVFEDVFEASRSGLEQCPNAETLWYGLIRAGELGFGQFPISIPSRRILDEVEAASEAASRIPRSVRIATVLARQQKTLDSARTAFAINPAYVPARVALAAALVRSGHPSEAIELLREKKARAHDAVRGVHETRAQALLALGFPAKAVVEARRELRSTWADESEPFPVAAARREAEEMLRRALIADRRGNEAARLVSPVMALPR